jgi:hypothetical protein
MKNALRFFGLLDIVSIILITPQVWLILTNFSSMTRTLPLIAIASLRIILFISLFISAIGLLTLRKFGTVTYYFQFLFRFVTLIFSFGFITYLNEFINNSGTILKLTLTLAVFGEFVRLYYTYKAQKKHAINF